MDPDSESRAAISLLPRRDCQSQRPQQGIHGQLTDQRGDERSHSDN
jgi:hypothetical protein